MTLHRGNSEDKAKRPEKRTVVLGTPGEGRLTTKGSPCTLSGETGLHLDCGDSHVTTLVCQNSQNYVVHILRLPIHKFNQPQISDSGEKFFWQSSKTTKLGIQASQQLFTQHLHCIRYYKKSEMIKVHERIHEIICKYKEPQYLWILFSCRHGNFLRIPKKVNFTVFEFKKLYMNRISI